MILYSCGLYSSGVGTHNLINEMKYTDYKCYLRKLKQQMQITYL